MTPTPPDRNALEGTTTLPSPSAEAKSEVPLLATPAGAFFSSVAWHGPPLDLARETALAVLAWL
jgi:hypothetical protein